MLSNSRHLSHALHPTQREHDYLPPYSHASFSKSPLILVGYLQSEGRKKLSSSVDSSPRSTVFDDKMSSSGASSIDENHARSSRSSSLATRTNKGGKTASPKHQSWLSWTVDKYTIQYPIPPAYAPAALQICITTFPLGILFGLVLPRILTLLLSTLTNPCSPAHSASQPFYTHAQLSLYLASWVVFHILEFTVTASYNPTRLFSDSFLLNNGIHYHIAHTLALFEFCLTAYFYPSTKTPSILTYLGLVLVIAGQILRSMAMIHAHNNFSHVLADKKRQDHELVTSGVYAWTRHPSYVGFTYWALGTQVMLGNKVALVGFVGALWLFFSRRIRAEERWLMEFFGDEYKEYRETVGTGLPFIR
ncbi:uncharacterized protein UDID_02341 [Ustilago sp. UG-2017a]|nr:uncharacterized protein UDID_02341 [Ustilago sp. UG-2017a]